MSHSALSIIIFAIVGLGLPIITILMSLFLRPRRSLREPQESVPYESGSVPIGSNRAVGFGYYQYALLFLLFDIAAFFLILASLIAPILSAAAFIAIFVFIIFLSLAILYALKSKEYLEI